VAPLRDQLEAAILNRIPEAWINGGQALRVCNTLNVSFAGVEGDGLVMALDLAGYSVSSGSACSSGVLEPSHVLMAMGRSRLQAMAAVRVSFSQVLPWEVLEGFVTALEQAVVRVRRAATSQGQANPGVSQEQRVFDQKAPLPTSF
jgi:cysteine desulfurase